MQADGSRYPQGTGPDVGSVRFPCLGRCKWGYGRTKYESADKNGLLQGVAPSTQAMQRLPTLRISDPAPVTTDCATRDAIAGLTTSGLFGDSFMLNLGTPPDPCSARSGP